MKTVAIIGGGIAGLSIAEALQRGTEQVKPVVLEADETPGGKIKTKTENGFIIETGPHGFLDKEPAMKSLVERLGLNDQLIEANPVSDSRYVMRDGHLRKFPMKPPAFLTSDILPLAARLRLLMEPWVPKADPSVEESIHDFASRRMGGAAASVLVDAFVTGIYGGDPHKISASAAFPRLLALESQYGSLIRAQMKLKSANASGVKLLSFANGLGVLIDALADRFEVRCGQRIKQIHRRGKVFQIKSEDSSLDADALVITAPAFEDARLTEPLAPQYAPQLSEIPYASVSVVVHGFPAHQVQRPMNGFGFLIPGQEKRPILGSIWASTVFAAHAPDDMLMFRTLLGGRCHPEHAQGSKSELAARALAQLHEICGINKAAQPVLEEVMAWPKAIPQYELGHHDRVDTANKIEKAVPGLFFGGNAYRGVAMIQCVADAQNIAKQVQNHLKL